MSLPSADFIHKFLRYDLETGIFYWRERTPDLFSQTKRSREHSCSLWNTQNAGKVAGTRVKAGYILVRIEGRPYLSHRLAWLMVHGEWPDQIDHIDGDVANNRIANLRSVNRNLNMRNMKLQARNLSGHPGVWWDKAKSRWRAQGVLAGKTVFLGNFIDKDEAIAVRLKWSAENGFHPNHGRHQGPPGGTDHGKATSIPRG